MVRFLFVGWIVWVLGKEVVIGDILVGKLLRKGVENGNLVGIVIKG